MKKDLRTPSQVKSRKKRPFRMVALLSVIVLAVGLGTVVFSQSDAPPKSRAKKYIATREIILDETSGKPRKPTAEETEAMVDQVSALTNRSTEGLTIEDQSNGTQSMDLEGRFRGVVLGRANADGTTEVRCVFTMDEAAEFLGLEEQAQ